MKLQISSGMGPLECQLAVKKLYESLKKEFNDLEIIESKKGLEKDGYISIIFKTKQDLSFLDGTILWVCQSPIRKNHKRKNWFIDISILNDKEEINLDQDFLIQTMHSGGKGGQNVNKVETGVRVTHIPTGITKTCTEERSQYMNKQKAIKYINEELNKMQKNQLDLMKNETWQEHNNLIRGNPIRTYIGSNFILKK